MKNINTEVAYNFTKAIQPDIILVSGTRLIRDKLLTIKPTIGIINLHTGLSPYIKGGPNCTNWCIANNEIHLIGNTVMWIDKGIDTGNIISTNLVKFNGDESLKEVHSKVMDEAHSLVINSLQFLKNGEIQNIKQEQIAKGKTYYTKQWNLSQKKQLIKNFKKFKKEIASSSYIKKRSEIKIFQLK